jgi:hypothetical protein
MSHRERQIVFVSPTHLATSEFRTSCFVGIINNRKLKVSGKKRASNAMPIIPSLLGTGESVPVIRDLMEFGQGRGVQTAWRADGVAGWWESYRGIL